jgi:hypothetical protein
MRALLAALLVGCAGHAAVQGATSTDEVRTTSRPPILPHAGGIGAETPWGGLDAAHWRPEAMLANATSDGLNRGWALSNVTDVLVSVPVKMVASGFAEYGDGQRNAIADFGPWTTRERPPLTSVLVRFDSAQPKVLFRVDRTIATNTIEVVYYVGTERKLVEMPTTRTQDGDAEASFIVPDELDLGPLSNVAFAAHPKGWNDWFPVAFRAGVRPISELHVASVRFADGRPIVDREGVSAQNAPDSVAPFDKLTHHAFVGHYDNAVGTAVAPFNPPDIHARFPTSDGMITTGVGQGFTWVSDERPSNYKVMYTCFERRNPAAEAAAPNGGVASGGGWHYIGDAAETILNDLENGPVVVGAATTTPFGPSGLPGGTFAYGLSDVAVVRWLHPGEAFVTPRGVGQDNYHWFYFNADHNVCTEEIVNNGAPPTDFQP